MVDRVYNFSPGPGTLPVDVLEQASKDVVNFKETGIGLIEMSHRSKEFMAVAENTESLLRELMEIPDNYKVLFLQGGASSQFYMVPMNLLGNGKRQRTSIPEHGRKKPLKKQSFLVILMSLTQVKKRHLTGFPQKMNTVLPKMQNTSILFPITLFMVRSSQNSPKLTRFLSPICLQTFYQERLMSQNSALFLPVPKRIWDLQV